MKKRTIGIVAVGLISTIIAIIFFVRPQITNTVAKSNKFADEPKTKAQRYLERYSQTLSIRIRPVEEGNHISASTILGTAYATDAEFAETKVFDGDTEYLKEDDNTAQVTEITLSKEIIENVEKDQIKNKLIEEIKKQKLSNTNKYEPDVLRTFEVVGDIENTGIGAKQAKIKIKRDMQELIRNYKLKFVDDSELPIEVRYMIVDADETVTVNYKLRENKVQKTFTVNVGTGEKGNFPQTLNIKLKNGQNAIIPEQIKTLNLDIAKTKYEATFELPEVDENSLVIDYKYEVEVPQGFAYDEGTNTLNAINEKVSLTIEKTWVKGATKVPEELSYKLLRKPTATDQEPVQVGEIRKLLKSTHAVGNVWTAVIQEDKRDSQGIIYEYSVEEIVVDNFVPQYQKDGDKLKITNTYVIPTTGQIEINVGITSDKPDTLPASIEVKEKKNGVLTIPEVKYTAELNAEKTAYVKTISNLPATTEDGIEIAYGYQVVTPVNFFYYESENELGHEIKIGRVKGKVTVKSGKELFQNVKANIMRNGSIKVDTINITKAQIENGIVEINEEVSLNDRRGNTFEYSIIYEDNLEALGFTKKVNGNEVVYLFAEQMGELKYNINFRNGNPVDRPNLLVSLIRKGDLDEVIEVKNSNKKNVVIFTNKPITDSEGEKIEYIFKVELDPENMLEGYQVKKEGEEYVIEYNSIKKDVNVELEYQGGKDNPEVTVELTRQTDAGFKETAKLSKTKKTHTFNVDKTTEEAVEYIYQLIAKTIPGYNLTVNQEAEGFKVIAKYQKQIGNVSKDIIVATDKISNVEVELLKNGEKTGITKNVAITVKTGKAIFNDQELTDESGNEVRYSLLFKNITPVLEGYVPRTKPNGDLGIEYFSPKQRIQVTKTWQDSDIKPEKLIVTIKRKLKNVAGAFEDVEQIDFEKQNSNAWQKTLENQYPINNENGDEYEYIAEVNPALNGGQDYSNGFNMTTNPVTTKQLEVFVPVIGDITPELPANIEVEIRGTNGTKKRVTLPFIKAKKRFEALETVKENDEEGNPIIYTIAIITDVNGYIKGDDATLKSITKINVKAKIEIAQEVAKLIKKEGKTVTIVLKANGNEIKTKDLNTDDLLDETEEVEFTGLYQTNQIGENISYTIEMKQLAGYTSNVENNKVVIKKEIVKMNKKVVVEYNGGKMRKPLQVQLMKNGALDQEATINNEHVFSNLVKNDELGNIFEYKIKVKNQSELEALNYNIQIDDTIENSKILLNYTSPKIDKTVKLIYQGLNGEKPKFRLALYRNNMLIKEVDIYGDKEYKFENLEETDVLGEKYNYRVEVLNLSKDFEMQKTKNGNLVISKKINNGEKLPKAGLTQNVVLAIAFASIIVYGNYTMFNMKAKLRRINKFSK